MEEEKQTVLKRLTEFYRKPGQASMDFMREVKALTPDDRAWFVNEFNKMGLPTIDRAAPVAPAVA